MQRYRTSVQPRGKVSVYLLLLPFLIFGLVAAQQATAQTTLVEWTFSSQNSSPSTAIPANTGSTLTRGGGVGTINYTSVGGPNGSYAYATGWANGANTKYWKVDLVSTGYTNLTVSSEQWSEYSFFQYQGPRDFKIQYSLNNSTWTDAPGATVSMTQNNQNMKRGVITNVALPTACDNQATLYLRWIMTSNTGADGSNPVSGGQNWIDNISIKGTGAGNTAPTISDIMDTSTNEDTPTAAIGFTVGDAQTAAASLTVTATSSNTTLLPNANIALGGSGAARTITLSPAADQSGTTTVTVTVSDGALSASDTFVLTVNAVNDAPVLAGIEAAGLTFNEDSPAIQITNSVTVSDVDDTHIEGATVSISSNYVASEDMLFFTNTAMISGSFAGGVLTLTGSDTKANYQAALRSVTYQNTNTILPSTSTRTVTFSVSDGALGSNTVSRDIRVVEINDPPTAEAGPDQTFDCILPTGILVTVDGSASSDPENDKLRFSWSLNGTPFGSTAVASITLLPGSYSLQLTVDDGRGGTDVDNVLITLNPDITPPVITIPPNMTFQTDPGLCTWTDPGSAIGKASATDDCPHPIQISNNAPGTYPKGSTLVTWTATDGSGNSAFAVQTITVIDKEAPVISSCPADVEVEGDPQNEGMVPNLIPQLIASDNCTLPANLTIVQNPIAGTIVGVGTHTITFTVSDEDNNQTGCTADFTVVPRVEIDPVTPVTVISSACKQKVIVTRSVIINNSGGNFANGKLQWMATTTAPEITLITNTGFEGDALLFSVDPRYLQGYSHTRFITITGYNSVTMADAINSPYTFTVTIQIEPLGSVSVTKAVGSGWTPFTNSEGHLIAEVKSNAGPISSFNITMQPCSLPRGLQRMLYVQRVFTLSSNSSSPDVDLRLYYTNTEAMPMITNPSLLSVWHRPYNLFVNLGGTSNVFNNSVEVTGVMDLTGPFVLAQSWGPKASPQNTAEAPLPAAPVLEQNYPNPFNPTTTIRFTLPEAADVELTVHDMLGRVVSTLVQEYRDAGSHHVTFDAGNLPGASYMYQLRSGGSVMTQQMLLLK